MFRHRIGVAKTVVLGGSKVLLGSRHHAGMRRDFQLHKFLRPELIRRFDEKIVFKLLCLDTQRQIARLTVAEELARFRERGFDLTVKKLGESTFDVGLPSAARPGSYAAPESGRPAGRILDLLQS